MQQETMNKPAKVPSTANYFQYTKPINEINQPSNLAMIKMNLMSMTKPPHNHLETVTQKPYRGIARFRSPEPFKVSANPSNNGQRTRNLSRTRGTAAVASTTTQKPTTTLLTPFTLRYNQNQQSNHLNLKEEINMSPKQKAPLDFRASPLFGLIMDERDDSNAFDNEKIEKIHQTLRASPAVQNGFFPVIQNGTPSSIL